MVNNGIKLTAEQRYEIRRRTGIESGRKNVESGLIFEIAKKASANKHIEHLTHEHFSNAEYNWCLSHCSLFPPHFVHPLVRFGKKEIDWVIANPNNYKWDDPTTWLYVIEYHPPFWKSKETFDEYKENRINTLRRLGVSCPILIYHKKQQWNEFISIYKLDKLKHYIVKL